MGCCISCFESCFGKKDKAKKWEVGDKKNSDEN